MGKAFPCAEEVAESEAFALNTWREGRGLQMTLTLRSVLPEAFPCRSNPHLESQNCQGTVDQDLLTCILRTPWRNATEDVELLIMKDNDGAKRVR